MPVEKPSAPVADAGYAPEQLDPALKDAVEVLTKCVRDVEAVRSLLDPTLLTVRGRLTKALADSVPDAQVHELAERLVEWLEKYARTSLNLAKLVDEVSRLRSFLAGGADSRPDLAKLSDAQLAEIVVGIRKKIPAKE